MTNFRETFEGEEIGEKIFFFYISFQRLSWDTKSGFYVQKANILPTRPRRLRTWNITKLKWSRDSQYFEDNLGQLTRQSALQLIINRLSAVTICRCKSKLMEAEDISFVHEKENFSLKLSLSDRSMANLVSMWVSSLNVFQALIHM